MGCNYFAWAVVVLMAGAGINELWLHHPVKAVYWMAATVLNVCVIFF